jgi:hypothetical protein
MSELPADIRDRLAEEYPGETYYEAARLVESLNLESRVLRSVVFLGGGRFDDLRRFAHRAETDWRDVVFWAEYEGHESEHPRQVRSMQEPFERR